MPDLKEEDEDEDGMGDLHGIDLTRYVLVIVVYLRPLPRVDDVYGEDLGTDQCDTFYRGFEKIGKFHMNGRIAESDWGA